MKPGHFLHAFVIILITVHTCIAQDAADKKPSAKDIIPFGKKLPPPDLTAYPERSKQQMMYGDLNNSVISGINSRDINALKKRLDDQRQLLKDRKDRQSLFSRQYNAPVNPDNRNPHNSGFRLTKDINALAESNPSNNSDYYTNTSYAILGHVIYFAADDGIHGNELWRSDGTANGTFMVMDAEPGAAPSDPYNITAANGKLYFSATTLTNGLEPWVSDGTSPGTKILMDVKQGDVSSYPTEFIGFGKYVYFATDGEFSTAGTLWKTDGTATGTTLVKSIGDIDAGGAYISQLAKSNGLLFFTFLSFSSGAWELWRSDGTDQGTYHVGTNTLFYDFPLQLTSYNNKLYFSGLDDAGRKLWVSDGTDAGTIPVPGDNGILIDADYSLGVPFPVMRNVLYLPGSSLSTGNGLYKYDASNNEGIKLVKDLTQAIDYDAIVSSEMQVVNNTLYFKVTNYNGGVHDELWSSKGSKASTQLVNTFLPGETINNLYDANGNFYFVKQGKVLGSELYTIFDTYRGKFPVLVSDIFKGQASSYPDFLTAFKGKLFFSAADEKKGNELFMTNGFGLGTTLVKDINTVSTSNSNAGGYSNTIVSIGGRNVLFTAYEREHGTELYRSDGTDRGTILLDDILPGEAGSNGYNFVSKNNATWFIATNSSTTLSIYKTNGAKYGLQKMVPDYQYIQDFKIGNNGLVFYGIYNYNTNKYELWRSDGTATGTILLSSTLYYNNYLNIIGNTAFFVAGDSEHGYELWKSDGSIAGTGIVKDINPGIGNSVPAGMFVYKNEVYFGTNDGANPAFWKSDGTNGGTIKLQDIDPWYDYNVSSSTRFFCISNKILYFSAINYADSKGTQLWKTDGTVAGTRVVKDVSPNAGSFYPVPFALTDINGTLFFIGNDEVHGTELWKSDGTETGTQLVKDIIPGTEGTNIISPVSFSRKLFFLNNGILWTSDGTVDGTKPVDDPGISNVSVSLIVPASDKLFLSGTTYRYGWELYAGVVNDETGKLVMSRTSNAKTAISATSLNTVIYPNPALSNATLQLSGNTKNVSVSITDMNGRKLWQNNSSDVMFVNLPVEKYVAGVYFVTVTNGTESKTIRLVKQ